MDYDKIEEYRKRGSIQTMCKMKKIPSKVIKKCRDCNYFGAAGGCGEDIMAWCTHPDLTISTAFLEDYNKEGGFPDWCLLQTVWEKQGETV